MGIRPRNIIVLPPFPSPPPSSPSPSPKPSPNHISFLYPERFVNENAFRAIILPILLSMLLPSQFEQTLLLQGQAKSCSSCPPKVINIPIKWRNFSPLIYSGSRIIECYVVPRNFHKLGIMVRDCKVILEGRLSARKNMNSSWISSRNVRSVWFPSKEAFVETSLRNGNVKRLVQRGLHLIHKYTFCILVPR